MSLLLELDRHQQKSELTDYLAFEPFDIEERPQWLYEKAREDGVDLEDPAIVRVIGRAPHEFQLGYLMSHAHLNVLLAGNQVGKSITALVRALCMATGVFPHSLRYNKGEDTGVKRKITLKNIYRWGRHQEGVWLPRQWERFKELKDEQAVAIAEKEGWDCGNIIGVGKFPQTLVAEEGSEIWIGTYQRAFQSMWNPNLFVRSGRPMLPETLLDRGRGNKGYSVRESVVYLVRNTAIRTITYESGVEKFEAFKAQEIILDEEPPTEDFFGAAQERGKRISLVETPHMGMTWTRDMIFGSKNVSIKKVFHCTQYDSPYCDRDEIEARRINNPLYRRRARVWGLHAEQEGEPYFNRDKLDAWLTKLRPIHKLGIFETEEQWEGIRGDEGLLRAETSILEADKEDNQYVWRIYEDPVEDVPYMLVTDHAEGADNPDEAGDWQTGIIFRTPKKGEKWPVPVAQIRSSLIVNDFADVCLIAARHYNNSTLCPESDKRGAANAYFHARVKDWPYFYSSTVEKWSTRKTQKIRGFDTNAATRDKIFKQIESWMEDFGVEDAPSYYDDLLLTELAQCVKSGKSGRADHKKGKTKKLDLAVTFGIGMFILVNYPDAIKCNRKKTISERAESFMDMVMRRTGEKTEQHLARRTFR
jgi:hypothetical protein